ncbi:hypothetical protein N9O24_00580, partial [bacterium]|nr:hypothetical protein [bacterium]
CGNPVGKRVGCSVLSTLTQTAQDFWVQCQHFGFNVGILANMLTLNPNDMYRSISFLPFYILYHS